MDDGEFYEAVVLPIRNKILENIQMVMNGTSEEFDNIHQAIEDALWGFCGDIDHHSALYLDVG